MPHHRHDADQEEPRAGRVHGYVYEVESGHLRRPGEHVAEKVNTRVER